jgi:hypothetical protein
MFRSLRLRRQPEKIVPDGESLTVERLAQDPDLPITLRQINELPDNLKKRIYRSLLPPVLLSRFGIDAISWKGPGQTHPVRLQAEPGTGGAIVSVRRQEDAPDAFIWIELSDNSFNGIDLNLLLLNDPDSPRFQTDLDEQGKPTLFGTARRNLAEEEKAMLSGLSPAQVRSSLGASRPVLDQLEIFLAALGHRAYFLEPLTYASAWLFERRGFAYVRGHKLMDDIHQQFQPGGKLYLALDGSTPFRRTEQWSTVRGRAWAIQDGILEAIDAKWNELRMVKQIGRHAGVETYPNAQY